MRVTARRSGGRRLLSGLVLAGAVAACAAPPVLADTARRRRSPAAQRRRQPRHPPAPTSSCSFPGRDGTVGTVVVQEGGREIVLDTAYASARTGAGGRLEAGQATPDEVRALFADALTAAPPRPVTFILYFVEGTDQFTPESQALVDQILVTIATRPAPDLTVAGHTDAVGTDQVNDALSLRRAERVRALLIGRGIRAGQHRRRRPGQAGASGADPRRRGGGSQPARRDHGALSPEGSGRVSIRRPEPLDGEQRHVVGGLDGLAVGPERRHEVRHEPRGLALRGLLGRLGHEGRHARRAEQIAAPGPAPR